MQQPYQYRWQPKLVINESFDYGLDIPLVTIVDDPDILRKCASSRVVHDWGDLQPISGYSIIHLIANGATEFTGANRNGDGFKCAFCQRSHPTFKKHGALYRHHINRDYSKRDGDILRTAYNDDMGRNELAVAASHEKCGDWLSKIEKGQKVAFSMGFDCAYDVCSICGHESKFRKDYCRHVHKNASAPYGMNRILEDGRRCFVDNPEGVWNDISYVGTGADMIAQHLRKVAALDNHEVIGGAELAEQVFGPTIEQSVKLGIAHKLSSMEKKIPALAFKDTKKKVSQKIASILREAAPGRMFAELARHGVVFGFRDFFKFACGDLLTPEFDGLISAIEPYAHTAFSRITADQDWLRQVCTNNTYDAQKNAAPILSDWDASELMFNFSIEPKLAMVRLQKQALEGEEIAHSVQPQIVDDEKVRSLFGEWAAYKLAALEAMPTVINDNILLMAVLTS